MHAMTQGGNMNFGVHHSEQLTRAIPLFKIIAPCQGCTCLAARTSRLENLGLMFIVNGMRSSAASLSAAAAAHSARSRPRHSMVQFTGHTAVQITCECEPRPPWEIQQALHGPHTRAHANVNQHVNRSGMKTGNKSSWSSTLALGNISSMETSS